MSGAAGAGSAPTIALFGLFGVGNIGNEASLGAALRHLGNHRPHADVVVVCARPDVVTKQHGVRAESIAMAGAFSRVAHSSKWTRLVLRPCVELARVWTAFRFVRTVDAFVLPGTGILDDFGQRPHQMPLDLARWSLAARFAGPGLAMISIGAGPIDRPLSRKLMALAARCAPMVTYRDEVSRAFMAALGVTTRPGTVTPDVAFALERPHGNRPQVGNRICVGVGVMAYYGWSNDPSQGERVLQKYVDSVTDIVRTLLEQGCTVRLLIGERGDCVAVDALLDNLGAQAASVDFAAIDDFDDLLHQVSLTDVVVATRYHNVIASLMMSKPTVSIGYADKNRDVMDQFGLGEYCHHVDEIDVGAVVADVHDAHARTAEIEPQLRDRNDQHARAVLDQFDEVFRDQELHQREHLAAIDSTQQTERRTT